MKATGGTIFKRHISAFDPPRWYIIPPPFTLVHDDVTSVIDAGYKFAADHPAVTTVLTGTANVDHLETNAQALDVPRLSEADTAPG